MALDEFKVIILGAPKVGKTSLMQRYIHNDFHHSVPQETVREEEKTLVIKDRQVNLKISDLAGQDVVDLVTRQFYSGTNAVILVYDATNVRTLYDADEWLKDLEIYTNNDLNKIPVLFVGNKSDLIPNIKQQQLQKSQEQAKAAASDESKTIFSSISKSKSQADDPDIIAWEGRKGSIEEQKEIASFQRANECLKVLKGKKPNMVFLPHLECSALTGKGVDNVFNTITTYLVTQGGAQSRGRFNCKFL